MNTGSLLQSTEELLVVFVVGKELYGVSVHQVKEIIKLVPITKIPQTQDYMKGVINVRGKVIPVINLTDYQVSSG